MIHMFNDPFHGLTSVAVDLDDVDTLRAATIALLNCGIASKMDGHVTTVAGHVTAVSSSYGCSLVPRLTILTP